MTDHQGLPDSIPGCRAGSRRRRAGWISLVLILGLAVAAWRLHGIHELRHAAAVAAGARETAAPEPPRLREIVGSFKKNQTVNEVLLHQGLTPDTVQQIIEAARPVYNLARVRAQELYWLYFTENGEFNDFRYPVDRDRYLTVYRDRTEGRFVPVIKHYRFDTERERIDGTIASSLFTAVVDAGGGVDLAMELVEIFGSDIDFNTDIQKGDAFELLVEKKYLDGEFSRNGPILVATMTTGGKTFTGIRYDDENGKPAYYAPDGKALKRSFLKAPLKVIRITSGFSMARRHPVLKIVRPHLGVDYAAPTGTPVQAVGSGSVTFAGRKGGNGNMVRIRHAGGYETAYLHLSKIRVKTGARVSQGDIIGNVGSTGISTGPHLDFRVWKNGKAINPVKVAFPPGKPVAADRMARFSEHSEALLGQLRLSGIDTEQAALEPASDR
ncbi:MAG: peptidoglycan DD-metalloendopeptidase family protein [Acidobacteria bacterium]|nr:peptidoglycan DD-metalloendopeptidase family protein [Acidobacteriota bacterium]